MICKFKYLIYVIEISTCFSIALSDLEYIFAISVEAAMHPGFCCLVFEYILDESGYVTIESNASSVLPVARMRINDLMK